MNKPIAKTTPKKESQKPGVIILTQAKNRR
jgi:hypothetical protein